MSVFEKEPWVHIQHVYKRAFLSEWSVTEIRIEIIVEMSKRCFFCKTESHEGFLEKVQTRFYGFLITVPLLYGPGFHFIVLDDIWFHQFGC